MNDPLLYIHKIHIIITIKKVYLEIPKIFYYDTHKIIKKKINSCYIKMDQEDIMFFKNQDESYTMIDLYLYDRFFGYKNSYNYYDIDVDKI